MVKRDNYMRLMGEMPLKTGHYLPKNLAMSQMPIPDFYIDDITTEYLLHEVVLSLPDGNQHADDYVLADDANNNDYELEDANNNKEEAERGGKKRKRTKHI
jgi:hypothetical protein